jgi:diguanylate cyclase (GGDEF)-like protein
LRRLRNPVVIFGIVIILLCWAGACLQVFAERGRAVHDAIERGDTAARLFEKDTTSLIKGIDTILLLLRQAYEDDPQHFDLIRLADKARLGSDISTEIFLIGPDGYLTQRTTGIQRDPVYLGDRLHFRAQVDATQDDLFIGIPIIQRTTGRPSIQVTRRLRAADGSFAGILSAQLDPRFVEQFSRTLNLGPGSNISVRGFDGVLRASYGFGKTPERMTPVMADALAHAPEGYFWGEGQADGIRRLVSYRTIAGYPLFVSTGETEAHIFENANRQALNYFGIATALTALTAFFIAAIIQRQATLEGLNARLSTLNRHFDAALGHMSQGISMYDGDHRLVMWNDRFVQLYGFPSQLVSLGRPFKELFDFLVTSGVIEEQPDRYAAMRAERLANEKIFSAQHMLTDGRTIAIINHAMANGGWVSTHEDITDRKNSEIRIEQLAHFDGLTGLANRNLFKERLEAAFGKRRRLGTEFAVLLLDLDRFKSVNDTLGHQAGDKLLKGVAGRIVAACGEADIAARLGGDEFAVIAMPQSGDLRHSVENLAARLIEAISAPDGIDGRPVVVGCSIGIALVPAHGERIDEILRNADLALYRSKGEGRNCFQIYSEEMKVEADRRSALEIDLREAIWSDQLEVHYQPVVDIDSRRVVSVEALARWNHPTRGPIPPTEFIPVAEQTGLIVELGNWIMLQACRDATQMPSNIKVAVNLSPVQFAESNIVEWASFSLADSGLPAERLEFEITEGVLMEDTERNLDSLRELKKIGISIALDDFGVGYSSLAYLTKFPFDKVKIDKSFIDVLDRKETSAVISSIVELANSLNLAILAEGIETEDQRKRVRSLGIKFGQGFLFAEPMPLNRLIGPSRRRGWLNLTQANRREWPPRAGVTGAVRLAHEGQRGCEALASLAPRGPCG